MHQQKETQSTQRKILTLIKCWHQLFRWYRHDIELMVWLCDNIRRQKHSCWLHTSTLTTTKVNNAGEAQQQRNSAANNATNNTRTWRNR
jgi:hypothetical protein